ncbi:LysR family transcriptional regulator [Fodinicola acaciae]|uniref:LysR substrate-binding domain-containing protein n=1 Tax=Fodinicola acaciae TaxID=2681555 RepID=UPI0013D3F60F|nr:LysR family transcriptional regulator [Fodinicola acaciae]
MDLSLRLVDALLAVAEEGSMTRAASRLSMTQQAVSGQIRQLERIVGTPLLRRHAQGVELTPAGEVVAKQGAALVEAAETMLSEARLVGEGRSGRLRIAFKAQSTAHFLPDVETAMRKDAPDIVIEPLAMNTLPDELASLASGAADAAFLWLPIGDDPRFTCHVLIDEPRMVALHPDHPLAGRGELSIADLADEPIVGPRHGMPEAVVRFWFIDPRPDGRGAVVGPEGRTPEECLQLVAAGRGSWIAPASTATYFPYPRLTWLPLIDAAPLQLALAWPLHSANPLLSLLLKESRRVVRPCQLA